MRSDRAKRGSGGGAAAVAFVTFVVVFASSCGGGGGGGGTSPQELQCASSGPAASEVVLACGGMVTPTTELVQVVLGGPTAATNIEGFNLDIVFDSTKITFVDGSAAQGALLAEGGVTPLLAVEVSNQDPNRVVVGIHRGAPNGGVGGSRARNVVLQLTFRLVGGSTGGPSPLRFQNTEAVGPTGTKIDEIVFKDGLSLSYE